MVDELELAPRPRVARPTAAATVLLPSGRPVTTPSSWWLPSGSGANAVVTSPPFSVTRRPSAMPAGTPISMRVVAGDVLGRARDDLEA